MCNTGEDATKAAAYFKIDCGEFTWQTSAEELSLDFNIRSAL